MLITRLSKKRVSESTGIGSAVLLSDYTLQRARSLADSGFFSDEESGGLRRPARLDGLFWLPVCPIP